MTDKYPRYKEVIEMFYIQGMTLSDIASEMEIRKQSASNLLYRAKRVLRRTINSENL